MGRDIPLGRFAGIKISMNPLVVLMALSFAASLALNLFPAKVPFQSSLAYWVTGCVGALLFFISLLAHEVGHALVARREGIGVEGISLWLLGGLAKLEHEAATPGSELRIAGAGPMASALAGLFFLLLGQATANSTGLLELFSQMFFWLGFINLVLAAFNLLPGVPLDGGRVLSALLWMRTANRTASQAAADRVGQVMGSALIVVGAYLFTHHAQLNGVIVAVVGGFILISATAELKSGPSMGMLREVRLAEVMDSAPPTLPEWMSVQDLVLNAPAYLPHTAFVTTGIDGRPSGLITAEAVQATDQRWWPQLHVRDLAFPIARLRTANMDDSVLMTIQRSRNGVTGRIVVLGPGGQVVGLTGADLAPRAVAVHRARAQAAALAGPDPWGQRAPVGTGSGPSDQWRGF